MILYEDEDVKLWKYYDEVVRQWILSVEVRKWSPSAYKKYLAIFANVLNKHDVLLSYVKGEKQKKFNLLFGMVETGIKFEKDNTEYEVMYVRGS